MHFKAKKRGRRLLSFSKREFKTEPNLKISSYKRGSLPFHKPPLPENFLPSFLPLKIKTGDVPRKLQSCPSLLEQVTSSEAKVSSDLLSSPYSSPFHSLMPCFRPAIVRIFHEEENPCFTPFLLLFQYRHYRRPPDYGLVLPCHG